MREYVVAKYMRLSMDDAMSGSMSLESQSRIIDRRIATLNESDVRVLDFIDNGYSGINFERPGIQEVLKLVRSGRVDCLVVKDFSRFGRNSIEVGYYIEQIFPVFKTRFISVSDNYDSDDYKPNPHQISSIQADLAILLSSVVPKNLGTVLIENSARGIRAVLALRSITSYTSITAVTSQRKLRLRYTGK